MQLLAPVSRLTVKTLMAAKDERFMREAIREARKALGQTSPNPAVGAVLTSRGRIVARGYHRGAGHAHAEIECLRRVRGAVRLDATLYVTMEPCCTTGRTGACTEFIIGAGIRRVIVGAIDPNPLHNGKGLQKLRDAGVEVTSGILDAECAALNEGFNKWITTGLPFVTAKCGMSLDGRLTLRPRAGRWITGAAARRDAQRLRKTVDAVMIGGETARKDNPRLTSRPIRERTQPWRVILTKSGRLPRRGHLFRDRFKERTLVYRDKSFEIVLRDLGRKGVLSVLVEGGGEILGGMLDARLIDKVQLYVAPIFTGGPVLAFAGTGSASTAQALKLDRMTYQKIRTDIRVTGYAALKRVE
jgi:diaminohydroxyphosphoribosylaminopyrimidine deaminase/5-amino-6-(5-phosphoribosylamino)uracil reductase